MCRLCREDKPTDIVEMRVKSFWSSKRRMGEHWYGGRSADQEIGSKAYSREQDDAQHRLLVPARPFLRLQTDKVQMIAIEASC